MQVQCRAGIGYLGRCGLWYEVGGFDLGFEEIIVGDVVVRFLGFFLGIKD